MKHVTRYIVIAMFMALFAACGQQQLVPVPRHQAPPAATPAETDRRNTG